MYYFEFMDVGGCVRVPDGTRMGLGLGMGLGMGLGWD